MTTHTQIRCKCGGCGLHFVICTWHPERFTAPGSVTCPECRQSERFLMFTRAVDTPVFAVVPGDVFPADWTRATAPPA